MNLSVKEDWVLVAEASMMGHHQDQDGKTELNTGDLTAFRSVSYLTKVAKQIAQSSGDLFGNPKASMLKGMDIRIRPLGQQLLNLLRVTIPEVRMHFPLHRFDPHVDLLLSECEQRSIDSDIEASVRYAGHQNTKELVRLETVLNDCVKAVRKKFQEPEFKAKLKSYHRSANENSKELKHYIGSLFDKHYASLLTIRLDLEYKQDLSMIGSGKSTMDFESVNSHRVQLLKYLRDSFKSNGTKQLRGYAWKLEFGLNRGYHCHWLLLFNAEDLRKDITIAEMIGKHWNEVITEGAGSYYNCNRDRSKYKYCGIGDIHANDSDGRQGLNIAADYMTKADHLIRMVIPDRKRTFGKGVLPKKPKSNRGRPRRTPGAE